MYYTQTSFMKPIFFYLSCDCYTSSGEQLNPRLKKTFMTMSRLARSMYGAILASTYIFVLPFPQISVTCFSNVSLLSNLTPSYFSHSRFFMSYSLTLILTASLELINDIFQHSFLANYFQTIQKRPLILFLKMPLHH